MTEVDDQTLEGGASEVAEELELTPVVKEEESGGDPLDKISDETARAEAKKWRAIARRQEKKEVTPETKPEVKPVVPAQEFLTKADFYKSNERKAIRIATIENGVVDRKGAVIMSPEEVKANWNEIIPFIDPRIEKDTPESILDGIRRAVVLYQNENPVSVKDNSADILTTTPVVKTGGAPAGKVTTSTPTPPNFKLPAQPKDWYGKK